jgi:trk system potassium uptake protein TrkA
MKAIIVGAGEVGFHIADHLSKEGHDVAIVEKNPETQRVIKDKVNALVVLGNGSSASALEEAGADQADLFIAVTDQDEVNLVSCLLAREFGIPRKIGRVRDLEFTRPGGRLGAKNLGLELLINPEQVVADEICALATHEGATEVAEFSGGRVMFMGRYVTPDNPVAGVTLRDLGEIRGMYRLVVTAITRGTETIIPRGEDTIQVGDTIYYVFNKTDLSAVNYLFGIEKSEAHKVFILGGGRVGYMVARNLSALKYQVKVIDRDAERAEDLARRLDNVLVLRTDGTDMDTLKNEGIAEADAYVAATQDDTTNILCSLLAKQYGVKRAISIVNQPVLLSLAPTLGVDACISRRRATASAILKYVRKGEVLSVAMLEESTAEVMEVIVSSGGSVTKKPLRNLKFPEGAIIGAVVRGADVLIPTGDDKLEAGDHVVVFTLPGAVAQVEKFFS